MFKALVLGLLLVVSFSYTEEDNVLVLTDEDFPNVLSEFSHILIEFYAPWYMLIDVGVDTARNSNPFINKLLPSWRISNPLVPLPSIPVRVAKVDATVEKKAAGEYQVRGFPTLLFFHKG